MSATRRLFNAITAPIFALEAVAMTFAADLRQVVSAREAASVEEFNTLLQSVAASEDERENARQAAIIVAQLGVSAEDIAPAISAYYLRTEEATS